MRYWLGCWISGEREQELHPMPQCEEKRQLLSRVQHVQPGVRSVASSSPTLLLHRSAQHPRLCQDRCKRLHNAIRGSR